MADSGKNSWWDESTRSEPTGTSGGYGAGGTNDAQAWAGASGDRGSAAADPDADSAAERNSKAPLRWAKLALAVAGAIVTLGGAVAVISQTTHWLHDIFGSPSKQVTQLEVSPNLGISFHQGGQLDPMSASNQGIVTVSVKSEPFELWFPGLANNEFLEICAATGRWVFASAAETGNSKAVTCLTPGTGVAAGPYGSGYLVLTTPDNPGSTAIGETRALPAAQGYEKYYVSNFADQRQIYLVVYKYTVGSQPDSISQFNDNNVEDFILNIG